MLDFGFSKLLIIGAVALIVLGPKRLPQVARTAGRMVGRMQTLVNGIKQELNAQTSMNELHKMKHEFELAANRFHNKSDNTGRYSDNDVTELSKDITPMGVSEHFVIEAGQFDHDAVRGFQIVSLHKQAMRKKRNTVYRRYRPKLRLRVRKERISGV